MVSDKHWISAGSRALLARAPESRKHTPQGVTSSRHLLPPVHGTHHLPAPGAGDPLGPPVPRNETSNGVCDRSAGHECQSGVAPGDVRNQGGGR